MEQDHDFQAKNREDSLGDQDQQRVVLQPQANYNDQRVQSEFIDEYTFFFDGLKLTEEELTKIVRQMYDKEKIRFDPNYFEERLTATVTQKMPNYQIVTIRVQIGFFRFSTTVYCDNQQSCSHIFQSTESRQQSTIYFAKTNNENTVIKCYQIEPNQKPGKVFAMALKQYCFLKVASALGVGPKTIKSSKFDLIFYQKCVQFSLERCQQIKEAAQELSKQDVMVLKKKMLILHHFRIMHLDIKIENIMYSPFLRELVFIDFGFSRVIQQKLGFKTKTKFLGSINYCSQQMRKLFRSQKKKKKYIDLYYNDIVCLENSIKEYIQILEKQKEKIYFDKKDEVKQNEDLTFIEQINNNIDKIDKFQKYKLFLKIKYILFHRKQELWSNKTYTTTLIKNGNQFMNFILEFPYYEYMNRVYLFIVRNKANTKQSEIHRRRMQFKKISIISNIGFQLKKNYELPDTNVLRLKLNLDNKDNQTYFCHYQKIVFTLEENPKVDLKNINNQKRCFQYRFLQLIKYIDLQSCCSTFQQKVNAWKDFKLKNYIPYFEKNNAQSNILGIEGLVQAFRNALKYYTHEWKKGFEEAIPISMISLVILDEITIQQMLFIIDKIDIKKYKMSVNSFSLLLFRIGSIAEWANFKFRTSLTVADLFNLETKIINSCHQLCQLYPKNHYVLTIYNLLQLGSLIKGQIKSVNYHLQNCKQNQFEYDPQSLKQLQIFKIYAQHKASNIITTEYNLDMYVELNQIGGLINRSYRRVDVAYMRFMKGVPNHLNSHLELQQFQLFWNILQKAGVLKHFSFFYYNVLDTPLPKTIQKINNYDIEFDSIVNQILDMMRGNNLKRINDGTLWIQQLLGFLSCGHKKIYNIELVRKIKSVVDDLLRERYLKIYNPMERSLFFSSIFYLFDIFYTCRKNNQENEIDLLQFLNKVKQIKSDITQLWYNTYTRNIINRSELTIYLNQKNRKGLELCKNQIQFSIKHKNTNLTRYISLDEYIGRTIVLINILGGPQSQQYTHWLYVVIKENDIFKYTFYLDFGRVFYMFVNKHTLITLNSIPQYVCYQKKILDILQKYPYSIYTKNYEYGFKEFYSVYTQQILSNIVGIIRQFISQINDKRWKNPYISFYFSFFLNINFEKDMIISLLVTICKYVDQISPVIRRKVMSQLLQYLFYRKDFLGEIRSKRRKIQTYISYLSFDSSLSKILRQLSLHKIIKKRKHNLYYLSFFKKMKHIFNKMK